MRWMYPYTILKIFLDDFDLSDPTIDLPTNIWEAMVDLPSQILTIIKISENLFLFRVDELSKDVDEVIDEINAEDNEEVINKPKSSKSSKQSKSAKNKRNQLIEELKKSFCW